MNPEAVLCEFDRVAREAEVALSRRDSRGCPDIEPYGLALVRLAKEHPSLRSEFSRRFVDVLEAPDLGPWELVAFCSHLLRWPELRTAIEVLWEQALAIRDHRAVPIFRHVLDAFESSWQDAEMFPSLPVSTIDVAFSRAEFKALLISAAEHLVRRCRELYCDPPPPENFVFAIHGGVHTAGPRRCLDPDDVLRELLRDDGSFRDWINLSPEAIVGDSTVIELCFATDFTKRLLIGPLALPFEPFHLLGPNLPPDMDPEAPPQKVPLPQWPPMR